MFAQSPAVPDVTRTSITVSEKISAEAPAAITVVDKLQLAANPGVNLDDRLRSVPGFSLFRRSSSVVANPTTQGISLRGLGSSGASRTLVLWDGIPLNDPFGGWVYWTRVDSEELERVEVARGPFSSLYGGNAMGGVINMITRPVDKRQLEVFGQYGSRDTTNYSLRVADRFFDKLGASFGYSRFQTGGYSPQEILRPAATVTGGIPVTGVQRWGTPTGGTTYQVGMRGRNWFEQEGMRGRADNSLSHTLIPTKQ